LFGKLGYADKHFKSIRRRAAVASQSKISAPHTNGEKVGEWSVNTATERRVAQLTHPISGKASPNC
jgi:hypothetical protein